jgi:hypothetical protein
MEVACMEKRSQNEKQHEWRTLFKTSIPQLEKFF